MNRNPNNFNMLLKLIQWNFVENTCNAVECGCLKHNGARQPVPAGYPENKVHGANMGSIWSRQDPGRPYIGPMNFAIWVAIAVLGSRASVFMQWWPGGVFVCIYGSGISRDNAFWTFDKSCTHLYFWILTMPYFAAWMKKGRLGINFVPRWPAYHMWSDMPYHLWTIAFHTVLWHTKLSEKCMIDAWWVLQNLPRLIHSLTYIEAMPWFIITECVRVITALPWIT